MFDIPHPQYKTERDGIVETRVEQKITIQSDGDPIDHDKALAEAIQVSIKCVTLNCKRYTLLILFFPSITGSDGHEPGHDSRED